jgi:short subunit dehydrogenase-like uncharacterized protein
MAGRSEAKLLELKKRLGIDVPHFIANADDESALTELCSKAKARFTCKNRIKCAGKLACLTNLYS